MMFEPHEIEFLKANEMPCERWLYDSNTQPIINDLCERGLMQPAYGEFGPPRDKGEKITLFGREIPVVDLIGLYRLTPFASTAYRKIKEEVA